MKKSSSSKPLKGRSKGTVKIGAPISLIGLWRVLRSEVYFFFSLKQLWLLVPLALFWMLYVSLTHYFVETHVVILSYLEFLREVTKMTLSVFVGLFIREIFIEDSEIRKIGREITTAVMLVILFASFTFASKNCEIKAALNRHEHNGEVSPPSPNDSSHDPTAIPPAGR